MEAAPSICPACGELIIVWPDSVGRTLVIPAHPDLVDPDQSCVATAEQVTQSSFRVKP